MFRWVPNTLALMAVQRQTAASRSASPLMRVQHGVFGGVPTTTCTRPLSKSAHTPNFSVSFGHVALVGVEGVGGFDGVGGLGVGGHGGGGGGAHPVGVEVEVTKVKKSKLRVRRKAVVAKALEAICK